MNIAIISVYNFIFILNISTTLWLRHQRLNRFTLSDHSSSFAYYKIIDIAPELLWNCTGTALELHCIAPVGLNTWIAIKLDYCKSSLLMLMLTSPRNRCNMIALAQPVLLWSCPETAPWIHPFGPQQPPINMMESIRIQLSKFPSLQFLRPPATENKAIRPWNEHGWRPQTAAVTILFGVLWLTLFRRQSQRN